MVDLSEARNGLDGLAANGATAATLEGGAAAGGGDPSAPAGLVLGTEDAAATPLGFSVFVDPERYLQLDDVVYASSPLPGGGEVDFYGVVDEVCAVQEGVRFASDVALASAGVLPAEPAVTAHVAVTRVEPEIFVPPRPGVTVRLARGEARDRALFFDAMRTKLPFGLSRDGEPVYANLEFLDGTRGAHVNISGISGVATKTSYAMFLLHTLFESGALGHEAANTRSLIFNVKGEDLLFLDRPNAELTDHDRARYARLGLPAEPFHSVALFAPVRRGDQPVPGDRLAPRRRDRLLLDAARVLRRALHALPVRRRRRRALAARARGAAGRDAARARRAALAAPRRADRRDRRRARHGLRPARRGDQYDDRP